MNPLERLSSVELRLNEGSIDVDQACAELFTGPKPWHTTWWKAERAERIGPSCSTCGSSDPPLVLQHTWQPVSWRDALDRVGPPNWEWWREHHPLPAWVRPEESLTERPVCPVCGSIRVRTRVRTKDWVCQAGQNGTPEQRHDGWAFPEPKMELRPDKKAYKNRKDLALQRRRAMHGARWQAWRQSPECAENRLKALRLCIEESKRYLSLQDTKTLCKSCAGREDYLYIRRSEKEAEYRRILSPGSFELPPDELL